MYSEITNFVYGLDDQTLGNYLSNLDKLCRDAQQDTDDKYKAIVLRIYDHSQLAVVQTQNVKEQVAYQLDSEIKKAVETFQKNIHAIERDYITILGIFSAIVFAFVASITVSSSVLQNIEKASSYRLIFIVALLAGMVVTSIYVLMQFIIAINGNKEFKGNKIKYFYGVLIGLMALIFIAWLLDLGQLRAYLASFILNWLSCKLS